MPENAQTTQEKQDNIIFQLEMILKTTKTINANLLRSIELIDDDVNYAAVNHTVRQNTKVLTQIFEVLDQV